MPNIDQLLEPAITICQDAGRLIKAIYLENSYQSETKADDTLVTSADIAAHHQIIAALKRLSPEIPILSEEDADIAYEKRKQWSSYWIVDPLDGTQEFVARSGDFASELALIVDGEPVLGVVYGPMQDVCYFAVKGNGAFKRDSGGTKAITVQQHHQHPAQVHIAVSRVQKLAILHSGLDPEFDYRFTPLGSASLKSCLVAEGKADVYVRLGPTGEWDTAAPQIILREAGGDLQDLSMQPLSYNQRESLINPNFAALGDLNLPWLKILAGLERR
ncbi:3'(2'),5'-bisphosphate nucleotidase [Alginatibacterium sediminis]|uniref:3'(2'),5'-bisphosphate nucleotidase CysQ n=1 Tax=Alginatibacterium sediminis TaxID=2164068 RepID=A0A420E644_9ALTE|nr:3'(2'),5'-bisphosphate nucleotidase CysQ [Alginatibacterium sediminis]RKF13186.1 3'(2'),5'-bisphosphate nucleotidase [Alginatibacterium sediminis]